MEKQLPSRIKTWLNNRGISDEIINEYQISWTGYEIVLPVHDSSGKILFNKYRRDPDNNEFGVKYRYDKGATSALYGLKTFNKDNGMVVVCEGELDCLCLLSLGIQAVSTTGGSSTFLKEWSSHFDGVNTFICYDFDDAGIKGSLYVHSIIPNSRIIWLPKEVGEHGDVTDYFIKLEKTNTDFLKLPSYCYAIPSEWRGIKDKKELTEYRDNCKKEIDLLMEEARALRGKYQSDRHVQILLQFWLDEYHGSKRAIKYFQTPRGEMNQDRLQRAKSVPIPNFIKFNGDNTARCIWHNEKTPSMHYYEKQNRVKCFGCDKLGDVIDVVQQLNGVSLTEAIKIILNEK